MVATAALVVGGLAVAGGPAEATPPVPIERPILDLRGATGTSLVAGMPVPAARPEGAAPTATAKLLGARDRALYRNAFRALGQGKVTRARRVAAQASDPLLAKVIRWTWLKQPGSGADFATYRAFLAANPTWPETERLRRRAEAALPRDTDPDTVIAWFRDAPPVTGIGMIRLGEALLARGRAADGTDWIRAGWVRGTFDAGQERAILKRHKARLRLADHQARLDRALWDRQRNTVRRMLRRVDKATRRLGEARLALQVFAGGVDQAIARVPAELRDHPGLAYERVRWRRKKGKDEAAREILFNPPPVLVRPGKWWIERRIQVRELLKLGYVSEAYRMARDHGLSGGAPFAEAEFLAGWLALRFLGDHDKALVHFRRLYDKVRFPISRARGAYWLGRAFQAAGKPEKANAWYAKAAAHPTTFYGQIAALELDRPIAPWPAAARPDAKTRQAFAGGELVRAATMLAEVGEWSRLRPFLYGLVAAATTPAERALIADLMVRLGRPDLGVAAAKRIHQRTGQLLAAGYPVLPALAAPGGGIEPALAHAVARQESQFDIAAVSSAGARGLMQLMPSTARVAARRLRVSYRPNALTRDPAYNVLLATSHLGGLVDAYDGSLVLALAAYNAGQSRVKRWLANWGDPRSGAIDAVDWIELIPFTETRNYVQRVLEGLQVYRMILEHRPDSDVRLAADLHRAHASGVAAGCEGGDGAC